jgi:hypothetical protein
MENELEDEAAPPRRRVGRPRGKSTKRRGARVTKETVTRQEFDSGDDDDDDEEKTQQDVAGSAPIFGGEGETGIIKIRVTRTDPNEGVVGYLDDPTNVTERDILERWGGSTYLVQAIGARNQTLKSKLIKIAGDPIFVGSMAEAQWRKNRERLLPPSATSTQQGLSVTDLLQLMREQQSEAARMENERREREAKADREHAEKMRTLDAEAERRRKADDEERESRRRRDEEDRDRRRQQAQEEADRRQQAFMQQTISMLQQSSASALEFVKATTASAAPQGNSLIEAVKTIAVIKEAFGGEGGGGGDEPTDPMTLIAKHGGEWLNGIGNAVASVVQEAKGNRTAVPPPVPQPTPQWQLPSQVNPVEGIPLPPALAPKVAILVSKLAARGLNPEVELSAIVDRINGQLDGLPPPGAPVTPVATVQHPVNGAPAPVHAPAAVTPRDPQPDGVVMMKFGRKQQPPASSS